MKEPSLNNYKKKVTLFATTDLSFDQRLQRISTSLAKKYDVLLVGRELQNSPLLKEKSFKQKRFKCIFNKGMLFYLEFNIRIFIFLLKNKTDIVVANDLDTILGVYFGSKKNEMIKVFDAHELFTEVPELKGKRFKKKIWKWIEKRYVPLFDFHYTVNNSLANIFKDRLKIAFSVVRNVPFLSKLKPIRKKKEKYILYQGALNKGRGLTEMIKAMSSIDIKLKIAGGGDIEEELKSLVNSLKLTNKIDFLGKLEPLELSRVTQSAFIGLNLLENVSQNYYYSLANKFFDYIQHEIPQVCMNFPEYKILNKENEVAILVKNLDKNTLTKALKNISEQKKYLELQNNCKKARNEYCWEKEEIKLFKVYNI